MHDFYSNNVTVTCAIGPNMNTLSAQIKFPSKPILAICLNFHQQNPLKNQYLPYLGSKIYEINSIQSNSSNDFQEHQQCPKIPIWFFVLILFNPH